MIFLARFWPYILGSLLVACLVYAAHVMLDRADQAGYDRATAEMKDTVAEANAKARSDEQAAQKRANEVDHALRKANSELDSLYAAARIPVVRLCPPAARPVRMPAATAPAGRADDPADTDELPGRDIGPDLFRIAREADDQTQRLIACQSFIGSHYITVPR